jgi:N-acetylmuramoyl-L-alanine amidase
VARVGCQLGHVPRTTGKTGTAGCCGVTEQDYVKRLFDTVEPKLRAAGHTPIKILADPPSYPAMDVFVAFHCDGSEDPGVRGCSFGFDERLANHAASKQFGDRWRAEHNAAGYPGGNQPTNYTIDINHYYALRPATLAGAKQAICIEFGFLTNHDDNNWLIDNIDRVANALVHTVVKFHGGTPPGGEEEVDMTPAQEAKLDKILSVLTVTGSTGPEQTIELLFSRVRDVNNHVNQLTEDMKKVKVKLQIT